jgi:hypothetical protein
MNKEVVILTLVERLLEKYLKNTEVKITGSKVYNDNYDTTTFHIKLTLEDKNDPKGRETDENCDY